MALVRKIGIVSGLAFMLLGVIIALFTNPQNIPILSPLISRPTAKPLPLEKYYFENLTKRTPTGSDFKLEKVVNQEFPENGRQPDYSKFTSRLFSYKSEGKKITGLANIPVQITLGGVEKHPVIIMFRGYADDEIYFTGLGTRKAAAVFAENGFVTLAPDFLSFGGSDAASADILEARFEKPQAVLDLLSIIDTIPQADPKKVFFWAHSNGGQIALSVLEITKRPIPTTLWAPVSIGFPQSILTYMDKYESLDETGKKVYDRIQSYLQDYDPKKVSVDNYWQNIKSPIQLHQGGNDDLVPVEWSTNFIKAIEQSNHGTILYFNYPLSDHNLKQDWDKVIKRDLEFFKRFL